MPSFDRHKTLTMINHGRGGGSMAQFGRFAALDGSPGLAHGAPMNGFLAICSICREIMS